MIALREPILSLLFERGAFSSETTQLTSQARSGPPAPGWGR
ncbi:hypothetical protein [Candidatus Magnetaquicoccus inordinatus]